MTQLQKTEFDILENVISVCEKIGVDYFLVCGSALGAVKYNGFIPWDDDVDIAMLRKDYETFCKKAPSLLKEGLFLQNNDTDPRYPLIYSKVRNSNTTYIEKPLSLLPINHGVYIDVFPIDGYPKDEKSRIKIEKAKKWYLRKYRCALNMELSKKAGLYVAIQRFLHIDRHPEKFIRALEKYITAVDPENSDIWCNHGNWQGKLEYAAREQYGQGTSAVFEGLDVRIPERYDEYLTQKYNDWREDLPEEEKIGHHTALIVDVNRPYIDYIVPLKSGYIRLKTSEELKTTG